MLKIGKKNKLKIIRFKDIGAWVEGGEYDEIFVPRKYLPEGSEKGDELEVFVYFDSEDRIIATTEEPLVTVDEFALLRVEQDTKFGAFVNWGLNKDLLVPFSEQKKKMEEGKSYIIRVFYDEDSERLAGSQKIDKFLDLEPPTYYENEEVELLICNETDLGYKVIINNLHWGILYKNEVFTTLTYGDKTKGFIKKVRDDKKIDVALQKSGPQKVDAIMQTIYDAIKKNDGFLEVTDKSSPEIINELFGVSKKTYKKAVGALYKQKFITIENNGLRIVESK